MRTDLITKTLITLGVITTGYMLLVRPWQRRWEATNEEISMRLPYDEELISLATLQTALLRSKPLRKRSGPAWNR